jgi:hypothetical protein
VLLGACSATAAHCQPARSEELYCF